MLYKDPDKRRTASQKYYWRHRTKILTWQRKFRIEHGDEIRSSEAIRIKNNPEPHRKSARTWRKRKYHSDPCFRLMILCRQRVYDALKNNVRSASTQMLIGCTIEQLMSHLESKFQPGMTWDNRGAWHVDHIKPCSSFDLRDPAQQYTCFHFSNLQPLWKLDNLKKHNKILQ